MELNLEVIQREVIKPSSPAPHDRLQLSVIDFGIAEACVPMIFFYNLADLAEKSPDIVSTRLRSSLSQALSRFYPLAGKKKVSPSAVTTKELCSQRHAQISSCLIS